jgi:sugar lactone lactonase YvrE
MILSFLRAPIARVSFRCELAILAIAVGLISASTGIATAQAPIGQSAFAQYLATLTIAAGQYQVSGSLGDKGLATSATLMSPVSVAYDTAGNLYICDTAANVVRKVDAVTGNITTVAGTGTAGFSGDGGLATAATLSAPNSVAVDAAGNIYIDDSSNNRIREITATTGFISTIVGNTKIAIGMDGLTGAATSLSGPNCVWVSAQGDVFLCDSGTNHNILRALSSATGLVWTMAGSRTGGDSGDGGLATAAVFGGPRHGSVNSKGEFLITDKVHDKVRIVTLDGNINAYAGVTGVTTSGYAGDGAAATSATLATPNAAISDAFGNGYIADQGNNVIRVVDRSSGNISTLSFLLGGVLSTSTTLSAPQGVAFGPNGQFAIADTMNNVVRVGTLNSNFAGTAVGSSSTPTNFTLQVNADDTNVSSPALASNTPGDFTLGSVAGFTSGACALPGATALVTPVDCNVLVSFTPTAPGLRVSQIVTTNAAGLKSILPLMGVGTAPAVSVSPGLLTTFAGTITAPTGMARDAAGNFYVAAGDNTVRLVSPTGATITTFAGTGTAGHTGDGGLATAATLSNPSAVAVDPSGNVFIADTGNNAIREVSAERGFIDTISFTNQNANLTKNGSNFLLKAPKGVATDRIGNIYIADTGNNVVRKLTRGGTYSIVAGTGSAGYQGDKAAATAALLSGPAGIFVDAAGNVFVADTGNNVVRKVAAGTGIITTVAGTGTAGASGDGGLATAATLTAPSQVVVDAAGDLYIASVGSNKVRMVMASTGFISTVAGTGVAGASADGLAATSSQLSGPAGLALDRFNNVYIADTGNSRIAEVTQTTSTLNFGSVQQGSTGTTVAATITNYGNMPLTFSAFNFTAGFAQKTGTGNDCSTSTPLAAGASCLLGIAFSPTSTGPVSGTAIITDNALNNVASTQTITLAGTGASAAGSVTATAGGGQTTAPYSQFPTQLAVNVKDTNGGGLSGIVVTFTAPSSGATGTFANSSNTAQATTDANGNASVSLTAGATRGTFAVTASVTGVTMPATFSETIAGSPAPTVSVTYTPATNPITYSGTVKLTATVAAPGGLTPAPSGTVTFLDAGNSIGTATLNNGTAVSSTLTPTAGNHTYTVNYAGDSNYTAATTATSAALTVNPLSITAAANSITIPFGSIPPALTGTLTGVLSADQANVTYTFTAMSGGSPITAASALGTYPISTALSGSAAGNYTVASTSGTVMIAQATTTSVLTSSYANASPTTTVILTDVLQPVASGLPTGSVTFSDNGTPLTGGVATVVSGTATLSLILPLGTHIITATYPGDTNFKGSASGAVSVTIVNQDATLSLGTASATVIQGQIAVIPYEIDTVGALTDTITLSCTGLPVGATCTATPPSFLPTPAAKKPVTTQTGIISVTTSGSGYQASLRPEAGRGLRSEMLMAGLFGIPGLVLVAFSTRRRRTLRSLVLRGLLMLLIATAAGHLVGCSSNTEASLQAPLTPTGTYTLSIVVSSPTVSHTSTFQLTVTKKS